MDFKPVFMAGKFCIDEIKLFFYPVKLEIYDNKFEPIDMKLEIRRRDSKTGFSLCKKSFFLSKTTLFLQILAENRKPVFLFVLVII
jgi:hypothetical protein